MYSEHAHYWLSYQQTGVSNDDRMQKRAFPFGYATGEESDAVGTIRLFPQAHPHLRNHWYFDAFIPKARKYFQNDKPAGERWFMQFKNLLETQLRALMDKNYAPIFDNKFHNLISLINN
jgi:hypothetical protein